MNYRQIVAEAWQFTQKNKKFILWYAAIPAFFSTVYGIGYAIYQYFAFKSSPLFENWPLSFTSLALRTTRDYLFGNPHLILPAILILLVFLFGYFVLPVFSQAALIQIIARLKNGQEVRLRHGLRYALLGFLPLFEFRLVVRALSVSSVVSICLLAIRNFGTNSFGFVIPFFIFSVIVGLIMAVFLTYTEFYIVIDDDKMFQSITKSSKLVVTHLEETVLLTILMLIIGLRILVQILFVLLIPGIIVLVGYIFTLLKLPEIALITSVALGIIGLVLATYFNGVVHVFSMAVWTFSFLKLTTTELPTARDRVVSPDGADDSASNEAQPPSNPQ